MGDRRNSISMERHEWMPFASLAQRVFEVAHGDVFRRESGEHYGDGDAGFCVAGAVEFDFIFAMGGKAGKAGSGRSGLRQEHERGLGDDGGAGENQG